MNTWSLKQKQLFTWIVYFIVPFSGVCVDVYVPSLPHIVTALGVSQSLVQMTIPLYSVGMALGQLLVGPVSDSVGRRPLMILGALLQLLCLSLIIHSSSIVSILILRVLQGLCLSLIIVPARVIFSDLFTGKEFDKKISLMGAFWALGSIIAPVIGGYLQYYFNWHAPFYFMAVYDVLILLLVCLVLRDTTVNKIPFSFQRLQSHYGMLLRNRLMLSSIIIGGILVSYMLLFNVVAPFFVQHVMGYSALAYGKIALLIGLAWFIGMMVSKQLVSVPLMRKAISSLLLIAFSTVMTLVLGLSLPVSLWHIVGSAMLIVALAGVIFPAVISHVMQSHVDMPGMASAFLFSGMWLVGSSITSLGSLLKTHSIVPLDLTYLLLSVLTLLIFVGVYRQTVKAGGAVASQDGQSKVIVGCRRMLSSVFVDSSAKGVVVIQR